MRCSRAPTWSRVRDGPAWRAWRTGGRSCSTPTSPWWFNRRMAPDPLRVLVHADESCLGNGMEPPNPGGNAALIEVPAGDSVARWDFFECSPNTTNQKMALAGAIAVLEWLRRRWQLVNVVYVSDSEYLIKGMSEWVKDWQARGWKRKAGAIENLELWQKLVQAAAGHTVTWRWVRGHTGHA